jgi:Central domain of human glycogen debranching enzyme
LQCASIVVDSSGDKDKWEYRHHPGDEMTDEDRLPQLTSPSLYHSLSAEKISLVDDEMQYCDLHGGCLSGLPSELKYSTETSFLTFVEVHGDIKSGDFETIITVDHSKFIPGSIVLYRTWVAGSSVNAETEDGKLPSVPSDPSVGVLEQLWSALGMDDKNLGVEIMSQLGADILDSGIPWCATSRPRWLPGLKDAVKNLSPQEINAVLFKVAPEERDLIGML